MPNRLTRIYTRSGDDGSTALADGARLYKDTLRIEGLGCVDELNCVIGLVTAFCGNDVPPELPAIQNHLFEIGAELASPPQERVTAADVLWLERSLDARNADLPPLREFILPGGGPAAAHCHLARAVCRRTERRLVALGRAEKVNAETVRYLNRLSDLLFVLARVLARCAGAGEVLWRRDHHP